ncbi:DUF721 domain-containing protein [Streptomyces scopuliridis]
MLTERGMVAPAADGSVLAPFDGHPRRGRARLRPRPAVAFDADSGRLEVIPDAPVCGTKLRWSTPKLIAAANAKVSGANVRALHVLAPAPMKAGPTPAAADPAPQPTAPVAPVERRTPPDGYRRAIEAHRQAVPVSRVDQGIAAAVERQTAAMRELSRRAFPEPEAMPDDAPASIEQTRVQRRRQAAVSEAAALRRVRAQCAAGTRAVARRTGDRHRRQQPVGTVQGRQAAQTVAPRGGSAGVVG